MTLSTRTGFFSFFSNPFDKMAPLSLLPGVMRMKQGDTVSVVVDSYEDNNYRVQQESGFFVALLHEE